MKTSLLLLFLFTPFIMRSMAKDADTLAEFDTSKVGLSKAKTEKTYLSLGSGGAGVCFGNSLFYSGLRLNFIDRKARTANGIALGFISKCHRVNGISFGMIMEGDNSKYQGIDIVRADSTGTRNGISISGLVTETHNTNGIALATLAVMNEGTFNGLGVAGGVVGAEHFNGLAVALGVGGTKMNGAGIAGWLSGDTLTGVFAGLFGGPRFLGPGNSAKQINGLYLSFIGVESNEINGAAICGVLMTAEKINGAALCLIHVETTELHGLSISLVNYAKELHGLQIGLLNIAKNNRGIFRYLPGLNFHR